MINIDLHVHSNYSYDGYINYEMFSNYNNKINIVAITDHNNFKFHEKYSRKDGKVYKLGSLNIIPGEEILTNDSGEIIGLFLKSEIKSGYSLKDTIKQIRNQGGLVYVPHPFDLYRRKSRPKIKNITKNIADIDIIEVSNGKYLSNYEYFKSKNYAKKFDKLYSTASDAHYIKDLGKEFISINCKTIPKDAVTFLSCLRSEKIIENISKRKTFRRILKKIIKIFKREKNENSNSR